MDLSQKASRARPINDILLGMCFTIPTPNRFGVLDDVERVISNREVQFDLNGFETINSYNFSFNKFRGGYSIDGDSIDINIELEDFDLEYFQNNNEIKIPIIEVIANSRIKELWDFNIFYIDEDFNETNLYFQLGGAYIVEFIGEEYKEHEIKFAPRSLGPFCLNL